jgi:hypothetical protein
MPPDAAQGPDASMDGPRVLAEFSDYPGFLDAQRRRASELRITLSAEENAAISGLPARYLPKLIGVKPVKRIGPRSFGPILGLLGTKLVMVEDADALARLRMMDERYGRTLKTHNGNLVRSDAVHVTVTYRFLRKIGRMGGLRRAENDPVAANAGGSTRRQRALERHRP